MNWKYANLYDVQSDEELQSYLANPRVKHKQCKECGGEWALVKRKIITSAGTTAMTVPYLKCKNCGFEPASYRGMP